MAEDILDLFSKYQDELKKDVNVDELNMKESALTIATIKHKWAGRLMRHKVDLNRTEKAREKAVSAIVEQMGKDPSIQLSGPALRKKAESHERIKEVDQAIENLKLVIEYLEKIEKIVGSMTWDIKNIIDIVKIETQ
jgi:geranylgeranyl pyrophosphate synthase